MAQVFLGQIVHTKSLNDIEIFADGFLVVDESGRITGVGNDFEEWRAQNQELKIAKENRLTSNQFVMPGFVDCHIHAPQVAQIGLGLDMPLLDWLNIYTFPLEAKFTDQEFATKVYTKVVESTIRYGTTLAAYFATIDKDSTLILAKEVLRQGQRALVGKVCSNCNCPDYYVETTEESVVATKAFISDMKNLQTDLVKPIVTPRFALSCDKELLAELGCIARNHDLHIQSHISESVAEIEFVKQLFSTSYAKAYDDAGLLTEKTVMAHGVHLEDEEIELFKQRGSGIAHCPASNTNLSSGFCDVKRLLSRGVKVGLGTDVSGGNSISMKDVILRTLDISHALEFVKKQDIKGSGKLPTSMDNYEPLNYKQALYLATLGGAKVLALENVTGNFVVGKEFDALLIDTSIHPLHNFDAYNLDAASSKSSQQKLLELVQKFIYVGDDRNIVSVFVAGKKIK